MRITQGTFSFLPDLSDAEIRAADRLRVGAGLGNRRRISPTIRTRATVYWEMWGNPLFDLRSASRSHDGGAGLSQALPQTYIRVIAFDSTRGFETTRLTFIVNRPHHEPGFLLKRHEVGGRQIQYTLESYAAQLR